MKQERLSAALLRTTAQPTELETQKKNAEKAHKEQNTQPEPEQEPESSKDIAADDKPVVTEDGTDGTDTVSRRLNS